MPKSPFMKNVYIPYTLPALSHTHTYTHTHTHIYIYTKLAPKQSAKASVAQLVERWFRHPEGAGSIPMQLEALDFYFTQLVPLDP